jgi:hypothetical protein
MCLRPKISQSQLRLRWGNRYRWWNYNWGRILWPAIKNFYRQKKSLLNFIIGFKIAAEECLHPSAAPKPRALGHNHINKLPDQVPNLFILSQKCLPLAGMKQRRRRS